MPMVSAPPKDFKLPSKPVTPSSWHAEGALAEWFEILVYFRPENNEEAQRKARKTTTENGRSVETIQWPVYNREIIKLQCTGWQVIAPLENPGWVANFEQRTEVREVAGFGQVRYWKFLNENIDEIPWDVQTWLVGEIQAQGGGLATESLLVVADNGRVLDFRRALGGVGHKQDSVKVPHPK